MIQSSRSERERKSCSCETTFRPTGDTAELMAVVEQLSADLAQDLASHQLVGKAVTLKVRRTADRAVNFDETFYSYSIDSETRQ